MSNAEDSLATLPPLSEKDFLRQVVELAEIRGWQWLHLRPGMTRDSWRTPISGPLGKGWPDLLAMRVKDKRLLFAELKTDGGKTTADQDLVLAMLGSLEQYPHPKWAGTDVEITVQTFVWHPSDWSEIEAVLR